LPSSSAVTKPKGRGGLLLAKQSSFRNFLIDVGRTGVVDEEGVVEEVKKERGNEEMAGRTDG
jgi:hypothetical protein